MNKWAELRTLRAYSQSASTTDPVDMPTAFILTFISDFRSSIGARFVIKQKIPITYSFNVTIHKISKRQKRQIKKRLFIFYTTGPMEMT